MLKIILDDVNLYRFTKKHRILSKFFVLSVRQAEALADPILHSSAVSEFQTPESPTKHTKPSRFYDIDKDLMSLLRADKHYMIHDMGVSNGITSSELYECLKTSDIAFRLHISDKYNKVWLVRKGPVRMYVSRDRQLICGDLFGIAGMPSISLRYFISYFLGRLLNSFLTRYGMTETAKGPEEVDLLFGPVQQLVVNGEIEFIDCDIFETKYRARFDVIRCMNLLNLAYFSENKIKVAIANIIQSLKEDGLLQIGRTLPNGVSTVSFFRKEGGVLKTVHECNGGSELKSLIIGAHGIAGSNF